MKDIVKETAELLKDVEEDMNAGLGTYKAHAQKILLQSIGCGIRVKCPEESLCEAVRGKAALPCQTRFFVEAHGKPVDCKILRPLSILEAVNLIEGIARIESDFGTNFRYRGERVVTLDEA